MLFGGFRHNLHRAEFTAELALVECHAAVDEREKGVILADADIGARIEFGAALTHEDVAGDRFLTTELLHAEATTGRIATVARRTACFLMCHAALLLFALVAQPTETILRIVWFWRWPFLRR